MSNTENFLEIEAKTIDEAIFKGLEQLGLAFDEATIDILEEGSKGFLGLGGRLAKVRLTRRDALKEKSDGSVKPQAENEQKASNKPEKHASPKAFSGAQAVSQPKMENISALPEGQPLDNTHPAMLFLKGLLDSMKIEGSLKGVQTQDGIYIDISGKDMGKIIGHHGETLDAMQYLVSLIANREREEYLRVTLDTEGYRGRREQTLVRLAHRLAQKAARSGRRMRLEPMNPYERRIIHYALQNDSSVSTASEGEEPNRRVVITPKR